jgi:dTDP-4-dehydrorhamnose 3,5-epimerase
MELQKTSFKDLFIIDKSVIGDSRGYFERMYCLETLQSVVSKADIKQINHSFTKLAGVIRGLHFQRPPFAEKKIITCIRGEVLDVVVDVRYNSPTFLKYFSVKLSEENHKSLLVPEGFAHGFQTLVNDCELIYFHTENYNRDAEGALNALDPLLGIEWASPLSERSEKDNFHPYIDKTFKGIKFFKNEL